MILKTEGDLSALRNQMARKATTNGVFDILHVGHIRFLQSIAKIADILIVCVNSDESVKRLKGEGRPIIPLAERMEILDALECVDYVVAFDEDTPCEILAKIKPDIHVKDSSYANANIPEIEVVKSNGGIVLYLNPLVDHSTTDIIRKIRCSGSSHVSNPPKTYIENEKLPYDPQMAPDHR